MVEPIQKYPYILLKHPTFLRPNLYNHYNFHQHLQQNRMEIGLDISHHKNYNDDNLKQIFHQILVDKIPLVIQDYKLPTYRLFLKRNAL